MGKTLTKCRIERAYGGISNSDRSIFKLLSGASVSHIRNTEV